ncbi:MAG TPA: 2'-5' RNA ligase family protein [Ktedonobacteraceae bacterium]
MARRKYSFWFMPGGAVEQKFSQLIVQLAQRYASPVFPPHITLLGSIEAHEQEIVRQAQDLASLIHSFSVQLTNVAFTPAYYQALFVKVDPSAEIVAAYQQVSKLFPANQQTAYMPHLSLLYGDLSIAIKQKIIEEIGEHFADRFEVDTLHLYLTEGAASDWQSIRVLPLR